jgi:hypothetical protein
MGCSQNKSLVSNSTRAPSGAHAVNCPVVGLAGLSSYIRLMKECWAQDPTQRPSFSSIARRLKAMQHWCVACREARKLGALRTFEEIIVGEKITMKRS